MADRVYHGIAGWRAEDEKHEATHIIISLDEYHQICGERKRAIEDREKIIRDAKKFVEKKKMEADANVSKAQEEASEKIKTMEAQVEKAEAEAKRQAELNRNLLRITRERANAKRGLRPKKNHSGYRIAGKIMQRSIVSGYSKKNGPEHSDAWVVTLECPYDATIPIEQIKDRIIGDLTNGGILEQMKVNYLLTDSTLWKGRYADAVKKKEANQNYLFDYRFMTNTKSGLWEIQISATDAITMPPDMVCMV